MQIINQSNGLESKPQNQESIDFSSEKFDRAFQLWSKYEDIAMHFNELIIKLRVQALGGLTISGTVATAIFKEQNDSNLLRLLVPFFLAGWIAIYFLDMHYYNRLLSGAADAIVELEKLLENIKLSNKITEEIRKSENGRTLFYSIVSIALVIISIYFWFDISFLSLFLTIVAVLVIINFDDLTKLIIKKSNFLRLSTHLSDKPKFIKLVEDVKDEKCS